MARELIIGGAGLTQFIDRPQVKTNLVKTLDFSEEKVQDISLETLRRTNLERNINGEPLNDIFHKDLLDRVLDLATSFKYDVELFDLFAANGGASQLPGVTTSRELEQKYGDKAVEATTLRRVYANIRLKDFDGIDDKLTTNLAVSFHQGGIEVGFGPMVKICHNQTMLGGGSRITTFGKQGTDVEGLFKTVNGWFEKAEEHIKKRMALIQILKNRAVDVQEVYATIGELSANRVLHDTKIAEIKTSRPYEMNGTLINKYIEQVALRQADHDQLTAWDLYDAGTELFQPKITDLPNVMEFNESLQDFIWNKFEDLKQVKDMVLNAKLQLA